MPTPTYDLIASNVLTSPASSVTFSSLPSSYRDLIIVTEILGSGGNADANVRFNSDTGSNYPYVLASGNGSVVSSGSGTGDMLYGQTASTTVRATTFFQVFDYAQTDKHKSVLQRRDRADTATSMIAARWASTSAINSVTILTSSNNFASGSSFYIYGIVS